MSAPRMVPSPNFDARPAPPDMIVLHYTDMADVEAAIGWLATPRSRVSAHHLITADGALVQMVDEADRAWHAGVSSWEGARDINARAVGIELDSPGHRPDAPHFPAVQVDALIDLVAAIRRRWRIPRRGVVAHSDIAPMRKIDPGERFPWQRLAGEGHALFVPTPATAGVPPATEPLEDPAPLWCALSRAGYAIPQDPEEAAALVRAFHRRHRPNAVSQPADGVTLALASRFAAAVEADRAADPPIAAGGHKG